MGWIATNGGINRGNAQPVARRTIFGERSEQLRRTILASEASRSENDCGERNEVYSIHRKYLASEASRSENSFGEWSAVLFPSPHNLRGKPLTFYFSKNPNLLGGGGYLQKISKNNTCFLLRKYPPTYWGFYLQKIALVFFYKNTPQLAGVFFTLKK